MRLCTTAYVKPSNSNLDDTCMHLTNYSINKDSSNYVAADDGVSGSKRSHLWFLQWVRDSRGEREAATLKVRSSFTHEITVCFFLARVHARVLARNVTRDRFHTRLIDFTRDPHRGRATLEVGWSARMGLCVDRV